jgi:TM2 domain-containing membrane protein YozV
MDPRRKSPVLAGLLSLVPGLGQVYLGYYARGFVHAITIGSLIAMLGSDLIGNYATPLFALFMVFFWLYNIIDAARRAALINLTLEGLGSMELPSETLLPPFHGSIGAGLGLIVLGAIFLSNTLFDVPLDWLEDWWPVAPLAVGIYLLVRGILERQKAAVRAPSTD